MFYNVILQSLLVILTPYLKNNFTCKHFMQQTYHNDLHQSNLTHAKYLLIQEVLINGRTDTDQKRNLTIRMKPELALNKVIGISSNWQHGTICTCSFHNWFPDMQMFILVEMTQQVNKRKGDRRGKLRKRPKRIQEIRIKIRGIERRFKEMKEGKWREEQGK